MAIIKMENLNNQWTSFYDKHTHGYMRTQYEAIFINKKYNKALDIFKQLLNIGPEDTSKDSYTKYYSSHEQNNLYEVIKYYYEKENEYYGPCSLEEFFTSKKYLFICNKTTTELLEECRVYMSKSEIESI